MIRGAQPAGKRGIGIIGDDEIALAVFQGLGTFNRGVIRNLDMDIGESLVELVQISNQIIPADGVAGSDAQLPSVQGMGLKQLIFSLADQVHGWFDML